ncbi:UPF0481 protein At3g47200-like [Zingiber officinale]|uniref:Uncharacterized protein n=1 Tax=Zingiber officinale TaxID=94328 RepID=A0A8J5G7U3_ZINOF|nr:UPF0481 protein At3g47200-like [Zingiber officinale]KAG6502113.1 hypothetical protein ZIOFF_042002 [Zingiber officinale]
MEKDMKGQELKPWRTEKPTIFRVPEVIRRADSEAYEPSIISFGPYHRGKPHLRAMDKLKPQYLQRFVARTRPRKTLEECRSYVRTVERRVRSAYSETLAMDSDEFVDMMLHDGCFVVELFLCLTERQEGRGEEMEDGEEHDPIFSSAWAEYYVRLDMLLLENQLPLFLIRDLLGFVDSEKAANSLKPLALKFFGADFLPGRTKKLPEKLEVPETLRRSHHILHLLHACIQQVPDAIDPDKSSHCEDDVTRGGASAEGFLSSSVRYSLLATSFGNKPEKKVADDSVFTPLTPATVLCARDLKNAGVQIVRKMDTDSFLDVTFANGRLEIPRIRAYNVSNTILRNLIAFEQLYPERGTHVTDFAYLMSCLIDTQEDVALLREADILVSAMGSNKDVANLFNRLCKKAVVQPTKGHLRGVFEDMPKHCEKKYNKWRATLNNTYFGNPWAVISVVAAILLFVLTIVQTVYSVLSYHQPP